ncbi:uncharacterized protein [Clytia hemisphaerica]|uniref:Uncharacterized protein n=1 Tax=Clytia hemisphaerica TaxID=252671 RepID=A0A7M5WJT6_9CNID|eukprot:TCONS_00072940-protein
MDYDSFRLKTGLAFPIPVVQRLPLEQHQQRVPRHSFNKVDSLTNCHCPEAEQMSPKKNRGRGNTKPLESFERLHRSAAVCGKGCYGEKRPEEFYDIFLASSVKESKAYQEVLKQREEEAGEQVVSYLPDCDIPQAIENLQKEGISSVDHTTFDSGVSLGNSSSLAQNSVLSNAERIEKEEILEHLRYQKTKKVYKHKKTSKTSLNI